MAVPGIGELVSFYHQGVQYHAVIESAVRITDEPNTLYVTPEHTLADPYCGRPEGTQVYTIDGKIGLSAFT